MFLICSLDNKFLYFIVFDCYNQPLTKPDSIGWWQPSNYSLNYSLHKHKCKDVLFDFIREWYSYHFPELVKIVADNLLYAQVVKYIKSRKDLTEDKLEGLEEIVQDEAKTKAIYDASRSSMGRQIQQKLTELQ